MASAVGQVSAVVRFTILSRILGPEQLGLAATIILTGQFFESLTDSGGDRFLIQDRDGDEPRVQALVQMMLGGRGALTALALVVFAGPIAWLYRAPQLAHGIALLALAPLINGLTHMDMRRQQRHHDFRTESAAVISAEIIATIAAAIAAIILKNFMASLVALIARSVVMAVVSHVRAERPYRMAFSGPDVRRLALFAAPLMLNGLLLFLGGQGDRVIVANQIGATQLGQYSAITLLGYYPAMALARFMAGIHLPKVAAARGAGGNGGDPADALYGQATLLASLIAASFAVAAPTAVAILFGSRYEIPGLIVGLVGIVQAVRYVRMVPTTVALAHARTGIVLATNVVRLVAFPVAFFAARALDPFTGIVAGFLLGEFAAHLASLAMIRRGSPNPGSVGFDRLGVLVGVAGAVIAGELAAAHPTPLGLGSAGLAAILAASLLVWRERATIAAVRSAAVAFWRARRGD